MWSLEIWLRGLRISLRFWRLSSIACKCSPRMSSSNPAHFSSSHHSQPLACCLLLLQSTEFSLLLKHCYEHFLLRFQPRSFSPSSTHQSAAAVREFQPHSVRNSQPLHCSFSACLCIILSLAGCSLFVSFQLVWRAAYWLVLDLVTFPLVQR